MTPQTLYRKLVDSHTVARLDEQNVLLFCDLHLMNEYTSPQAFAGLHEKHRFAPSAAQRARDHHNGAVESGEIRAPDLSPEDEQLLTQKHVFGEQESAWSEQVGD